MHVFARRITQQAELSGSGTCRGKVSKAAARCRILGKGRGEGLDALEDELETLDASGLARLGTTRNAVWVAVYAGHELG